MKIGQRVRLMDIDDNFDGTTGVVVGLCPGSDLVVVDCGLDRDLCFPASRLLNGEPAR